MDWSELDGELTTLLDEYSNDPDDWEDGELQKSVFVLAGFPYQQVGDALVKIAHGSTRVDNKGRVWWWNQETKAWRLQKTKEGVKVKPGQTATLDILHANEGDMRTISGQPHIFQGGQWNQMQHGDSVQVGSEKHVFQNGRLMGEAEHQKVADRIAGYKQDQQKKAKRQAAASGKRKSKITLTPKDGSASQDLPTLEDLFIDADRVGNKYQTPAEREAFQQQINPMVEEIGRAADALDGGKAEPPLPTPKQPRVTASQSAKTQAPYKSALDRAMASGKAKNQEIQSAQQASQDPGTEATVSPESPRRKKLEALTDKLQSNQDADIRNAAQTYAAAQVAVNALNDGVTPDVETPVLPYLPPASGANGKESGRAKTQRLLDELQQNHDADIRNAAGIHTVAQVATDELGRRAVDLKEVQQPVRRAKELGSASGLTPSQSLYTPSEKEIERISRTAEDGARYERRLSEAEAKIKAQSAPYLQPRAVFSAEWDKLDGVDVLRIPGSDFVAVPASGRKNSSQFAILDLNDRSDFVAQVTKKEVHNWLSRKAQDEGLGSRVDVPTSPVVESLAAIENKALPEESSIEGQIKAGKIDGTFNEVWDYLKANGKRQGTKLNYRVSIDGVEYTVKDVDDSWRVSSAAPARQIPFTGIKEAEPADPPETNEPVTTPTPRAAKPYLYPQARPAAEVSRVTGVISRNDFDYGLGLAAQTGRIDGSLATAIQSLPPERLDILHDEMKADMVRNSGEVPKWLNQNFDRIVNNTFDHPKSKEQLTSEINELASTIERQQSFLAADETGSPRAQTVRAALEDNQEKISVRRAQMEALEAGQAASSEAPQQDAVLAAPVIPAQVTAADVKEMYGKLQRGELSAAELKQGWEAFKSSKESIAAELGSRKKDEILKDFTFYGAKNMTKKELVSRSVGALESAFAPEGLQWQPFSETKEAAIDREVDRWTDKMIQDAAAKRKADRDSKLKAIQNPETLDEFRTFLSYRSIDKLTPEQKDRYDQLTAASGKAQRQEQSAKKAEAVKASGGMAYEKIKHSKTGEDLHSVKLTSKVDYADYKEYERKAKGMGGYYSRFSKSFLFPSKDAAQQFMSPQSEPPDVASEQETQALPESDKARSHPAADRIQAQAQKIKASAEESLGRDRLANTHRRASMAASAEESAQKSIALANTMLNVADGIRNGEVEFLDRLSTKANFEQLESRLSRAFWNSIRKESQDTGRSTERLKEREMTPDDIRFASYPYPYVHKESLKRVAEAAKQVPGMKQASDKMMAMWRATETGGNAHSVEFVTIDGISDLRDFVAKASVKAKTPGSPLAESQYEIGQIQESLADYDRMQRCDITNEAELKASLREYLTYRSGAEKANPIKQMERDLIGRKIPGYFPTPVRLAQSIAAQADIKPGMKVLEPSAGKGTLVEAAISAGAKPEDITTLEMDSTLAGILQAKGFNPQQSDFMEFNEGQYDRIVMNPPFENGQDADHVRHAYDLLAPGGKMVAIMSEGLFFRPDRKSADFRAWLDSTGGISQQLPVNSFKLSDNSTGVNTRTVVIEKPITENLEKATQTYLISNHSFTWNPKRMSLMLCR